jgi:hypothetical protein
MDEKKLSKHFSLAAARPQIRDKDNAEPRVKPPVMARDPAPNLAPPGMVGIRRTPETVLAKPVTKEPEKSFRDGDLSRKFTPLAMKGKDDDRSR